MDRIVQWLTGENGIAVALVMVMFLQVVGRKPKTTRKTDRKQPARVTVIILERQVLSPTDESHQSTR